MRQKRNRVRCFFWAGLLGLWVFFGLPAVVSASETGLNEEIADLQQELLGELDLEEIDRALQAGEGTEGLSFREVLDQILEADGELFSRGILRELAAGAFSDLSRSKDLLVQILVLTVAFSFFHHFMNLFENSQISKTGFYLYFLILMVLLMRSYLLMDQLLQQVLEQTVEVMQAVIPAFCMTMVFASAQTTAAVFYQISLAVIWLVERLLCYVVAPGIHIYVVLQMLNYMTGERMISRFTRLLKQAIRWSLRFMLAGVTGMNVIENMIAPSVDNLKKMSITKTLGMIPGLGGTAEAVSDIFLGSAAVIKNGVGAAAMVILMALMLGPVIKMLIFAVFYRLAGAVVQPFADKNVCGCIESVGEGAGLLLQTLVTAALLFLITIAIVITAVR